jgi:signal peptidase I
MIRALKLIAITMSVAIISGFVFMIVAPFCGWHFDVVPTGSMEPAIMPGGMIISRPAEIEDISLGDIVLRRELRTGALICHRVVDIKETDNGIILQTKGDANKYPDTENISTQNLAGKMTFYIPNIGKIAYSSNLYKITLNILGLRLSLASIVIIGICLVILVIEFCNLYDWITIPESQKYKERLKARKTKISDRKKAFHLR